MSNLEDFSKLKDINELNEKVEFISNSDATLNRKNLDFNTKNSIIEVIKQLIDENKTDIKFESLSKLVKLYFELNQEGFTNIIPYLRGYLREKISLPKEYLTVVMVIKDLNLFFSKENEDNSENITNEWLGLFKGLITSKNDHENSISRMEFSTERLISELINLFKSNPEIPYFASSLYSFFLKIHDFKINNITEKLSDNTPIKSFVATLVSLAKDEFFLKMNPNWFGLIRSLERKYHSYDIEQVVFDLKNFHISYKGDEPQKSLSLLLLSHLNRSFGSGRLIHQLFSKASFTFDATSEQDIRKTLLGIIYFSKNGNFFEKSRYPFLLYFMGFQEFFKLLSVPIMMANLPKETLRDIKILELEANLVTIKALLNSKSSIFVNERGIIDDLLMGLLNNHLENNELTKDELVDLINNSPWKHDNLLTWLFATKFFCVYCNKELEKGTQICINCGKPIEKAEESIEFDFSSVLDLMEIENELRPGLNINEMNLPDE